MTILRQYIISIVTVSLMCGILTCIVKDTGIGKTIKLICAICLTITVFSPIKGLRNIRLEEIFDGHSEEYEAASTLGKDIAANAMVDIIKNKVEAYILDKAKAMDSDIQVKVEISHSDPYVPNSVLLQGTLSAEKQAELQQIIWEDLGIPKENQLWIGKE